MQNAGAGGCGRSPSSQRSRWPTRCGSSTSNGARVCHCLPLCVHWCPACSAVLLCTQCVCPCPCVQQRCLPCCPVRVGTVVWCAVCCARWGHAAAVPNAARLVVVWTLWPRGHGCGGRHNICVGPGHGSLVRGYYVVCASAARGAAEPWYVGLIAAQCQPSIAASSRLRILPDGFRGRSSRNTTSRGAL